MHTYLSVYLLTYPLTIYPYTYMVPTNLSCLLGRVDSRPSWPGFLCHEDHPLRFCETVKMIYSLMKVWFWDFQCVIDFYSILFISLERKEIIFSYAKHS